MNNALFPFRALISPMDNTQKKQRSIEELAQFVDFARFRSILDKHCRHPKKSNAGRPPYDLIKMLKIIILQTLYNLNDEEMEFQLSDRISFMRFCGIDACDRIPDATTIWRFKESLGEKGTRELFGTPSDVSRHFPWILPKADSCGEGRLSEPPPPQLIAENTTEHSTTPEAEKIKYHDYLSKWSRKNSIKPLKCGY